MERNEYGYEVDLEELGGHYAPMDEDDRALIKECLADIFAMDKERELNG